MVHDPNPNNGIHALCKNQIDEKREWDYLVTEDQLIEYKFLKSILLIFEDGCCRERRKTRGMR